MSTTPSRCPEQIKAAVQRMGVPTRAEIEMLASRVEALGRELDEIERSRRLPAQDTGAVQAGARGIKKRRPRSRPE